jgi:hypothetical protein
MGGRLPATIQQNQRSQGRGPRPPKLCALFCVVTALAISLPFAPQERRTAALLVRRFAGASISFDLHDMDITRSRRKWRNESSFDTQRFRQAVFWLFIINAVLYIVVR